MLSHDNLTFTGELVADMFCVKRTEERVVSYLPLSHVAAQLHDLYICLGAGSSPIYFAQPDALKGTLKDTILEVKPTRMLGVPRVWEKMYASLIDTEKRMGFVGKKLFAFARRVGTEEARLRNQGSKSTVTGHALASLIHRKVRKAIGFDNTVTFVSGAAPLNKDIVEYFHSLDIPILEIYGMSESSAPHTSNFPYRTRIGTVGRTIPYLETRLHDMNSTGEGEVCMRGRNVFMGYLNQEEKTKECIDSEGWLHSGDLGRFDEDQYLRITGRIKELLITAGGENVAPVPIEDNIKKELPCISNVMVIGDKRKFLSAILSFKTEIDLDTMLPVDKLLPAALEWLQPLGCSATSVKDVLQGQNEAVMEAIQKGINLANKRAVSNAQKVQKWVIIPQDFSIPGGELGPTLKLKRPIVSEKYSDVIERLYQDV
jgi:long-chain-fatty-acid--CoA ligase ACSBG